jgi:hypothetical protein
MGGILILEKRQFKEIRLDDPFFESLKNDYPGFDSWFLRKAAAHEVAYVFYNDLGPVDKAG